MYFKHTTKLKDTTDSMKQAWSICFKMEVKMEVIVHSNSQGLHDLRKPPSSQKREDHS